MENIYIKDLVNAVKGKLVSGDPCQAINNISTDTRKLHQGDVFFALKGLNYDAHDFVIKAIGQGASAVIVSRIDDKLNKTLAKFPAVVLVKDTLEALDDFAAYYRRQFNPSVIAITGSNGKTTTKEMLYSILSLCGPVLTSKENYNNLIGLPLTLFNLNKEHKYCVIELGISLKGEMDKLVSICKPHTGIITNIGRTHLEFLDSREGVLAEKVKLFESLPENGTAVLNMADGYLKKIKTNFKCRIITYGLSGSENVSATDIGSDKADKVKFKLHVESNSIDVVLPLSGGFNVLNALGAAGAARSLSVDIKKIKQGLEKFMPPKMRMEYITLDSGTLIINDAYNANPDSMQQTLLNLVKSYPDRLKIAVLGDMLELGEQSEREHILLGQDLARLPLDEVYLYGDKIKSALQKNRANMEYFSDQGTLISKLKTKINKSTVILFKASRRIGLEKIIEAISK